LNRFFQNKGIKIIKCFWLISSNIGSYCAAWIVSKAIENIIIKCSVLLDLPSANADPYLISLALLHGLFLSNSFSFVYIFETFLRNFPAVYLASFYCECGTGLHRYFLFQVTIHVSLLPQPCHLLLPITYPR
jgi:hypothetical protein